MKNADSSLIECETNRREIARKRWALLANALIAKKHQSNVDSNFLNIFTIIPLPELSTEDAIWYQYSADIKGDTVRMKIRHVLRTFTMEELTGFNNTGNIRVWPSEEALAYVCLKNKDVFDGKSVLEVGGGMSCMAGILLAQYSECSSILVTDGNILSVENVGEIIKQNEPLLKCPLTCDILIWNKYSEHGTIYDVILAADCLFFEDSRVHLIKLMYNLLKQDGIVLITTPKRGETLSKFITEARNIGFSCTMYREYDERIWSQHLKLSKDGGDYEEDIHYPLFLVLDKHQSSGPSAMRTLWRNYLVSMEIEKV